jgi:AcrR family transcriptional regulator
MVDAPRRQLQMSTSRPRRAPLSKEAVFQAALDLADAEGIEALTMRRLAEALGVEAMSLYHHARNKDVILDAMIDRVFAEIELPRPEEGWRDGLARRARSARAALRRHPWATRLMESRSNPGPANLTHHDAMLGCLRRGGFSVPLAAHAYAVLDAYVYGFVHTEQMLPFQSGDELHAFADTMLAAIPAGVYPHLVELTRDHVLQPGYAFAHEFEWGLTLLLDGLEARRAGS